jgi:hypothetical protein
MTDFISQYLSEALLLSSLHSMPFHRHILQFPHEKSNSVLSYHFVLNLTRPCNPVPLLKFIKSFHIIISMMASENIVVIFCL